MDEANKNLMNETWNQNVPMNLNTTMSPLQFASTKTSGYGSPIVNKNQTTVGFFSARNHTTTASPSPFTAEKYQTNPHALSTGKSSKMK